MTTPSAESYNYKLKWQSADINTEPYEPSLRGAEAVIEPYVKIVKNDNIKGMHSLHEKSWMAQLSGMD